MIANMDTLSELSEPAWKVRALASTYGPTKVGCAVLSECGQIFTGCNIEHRFRAHDIHAEVNALSSLVSSGALKAVAVWIAAEREQFTPCGSCMDWIFEIGGPDCLVMHESKPGASGLALEARELMPYYPR